MPAPKTISSRDIANAYPGRADQVQAVRADLRAFLNDCPIADDAVLCASELAANSAIHSLSRMSGGQFTVRAEIRPGDYVSIAVEDSGGLWLRPGPAIDRGHGLDIVRSLAAEWGINHGARSRTIWARLDWPDNHSQE